MNVSEVLKWIETADEGDLQQVADTLIDRQLVASLDDVVDHSYDYDDRDDDLDPDLLVEAAARLRRRDFGEALHILSRALGRDFDGLETIPVGA